MNYTEKKVGKYVVRTTYDGDKEWYYNGKLHRENGPAVEYADGDKEWWLNGEGHREDGPAIEYADVGKSWYLEGKQYTEEEWQFKMRKKKLKVLGI